MRHPPWTLYRAPWVGYCHPGAGNGIVLEAGLGWRLVKGHILGIFSGSGEKNLYVCVMRLGTGAVPSSSEEGRTRSQNTHVCSHCGKQQLTDGGSGFEIPTKLVGFFVCLFLVFSHFFSKH